MYIHSLVKYYLWSIFENGIDNHWRTRINFRFIVWKWLTDIEWLIDIFSGRFSIDDVDALESLKRRHCIALRYVDDKGQSTSDYPMNPNGSVDAIAAISSPDGRHLVGLKNLIPVNLSCPILNTQGMMPHPERSFMKWQLPWQPASWARYVQSPWKKMFDNAFEWSFSH